MKPLASRAYTTQASGSNFYYSFLFLSQQKRQAIMALYAFCRVVDDIVDQCDDPLHAQRELACWHQEISKLYQDQAEHPITQALQPFVSRYHLPQNYFHEHIDGMAMDLSSHSYATFDDLEKYCYRAAGVVGLLSTHIFGYCSDETLTFGNKLGIALQLVNIIRDVGEDAQRGRIYLPQDELVQFNVTPQMLKQQVINDNVQALLAQQAARARRYYKEAMGYLDPIDRQAHIASLIMANIYFHLLDKIEQSRFSVLQHTIRLSRLKKLLIAWRTYQSEKQTHRQQTISLG